MPKNNLKVRDLLEFLTVFRRSLIYQTKEFFQNSTLHGVRYIAETGRPVGEKFMWFCFTSIGAVTALVIIMSLWEKFQTNPTITGLDTDFHNQNVVFPTVVVCPDMSYDHDKAYDVALNYLTKNDPGSAMMIAPFLELLTTLSFSSLRDALMLSNTLPKGVLKKTLRYWAYQVHANCKNLLIECKYRDETIKCCSHFDLVYTEHGVCYAFNSRFKSTEDGDIKTGPPHDLYETDKKWALFFVPNDTSKIFIFSNEEYFGNDFNHQIEWSDGQLIQMRISKKNTYTTNDARQLTIGQRKCIFHDEVKLQYFPDDYTFSSCMKECRMKKAIKLCNCNPSFYKPTLSARSCNVEDFDCLERYTRNITNIKDCLHCELSCSKTVFNIDKLIKNAEPTDKPGVLIEFLTWPIIRYKREVLFGWVDLLVSFGGIASLFLGFSLLSGVEIVYYFTLRACCMVYKNRKELYEMEEAIKGKPAPFIDLSLRMRRHFATPENFTVKQQTEDTINNLNDNKELKEKSLNFEKPQNNLLFNVPAAFAGELGRQRKNEKDYTKYSKSIFKQSKTISQYPENDSNWQYGQYLP